MYLMMWSPHKDCSAYFAGVACSLLCGLWSSKQSYWGAPRSKPHLWPLRAEGRLQPTAFKKTSPSVLQLQETESANNPGKTESTAFPQGTSEETTISAKILVGVLWDPNQRNALRPALIPDCGGWKTAINMYCHPVCGNIATQKEMNDTQLLWNQVLNLLVNLYRSFIPGKRSSS